MPDIITTGKIYCVEDAHTRSNTIYNIHDEDVNIESVAVGKHSQGYQCYGFFKFAPHGIPDNAVIVSAVFGGRVYERLQSAQYSLTVRPCGGPWEDTEITYKTMPTSAGASALVSMGDVYSYFEADVTSIAQGWFGGGYAYANGLYITSSEANSYKRVYSCTAAEASRPYIILTYYVPASKPTTDVGSIEIASGAAVNITTNRMSGDYTHRLRWALGSAGGTIATGVTASYRWTLSAANVSALLAALPAAESGALKILCDTYDETGALLGTESANITAAVPASVVPVISRVSFSDNDKRLGILWAGVSDIGVVTAASPGAGSTLASISVTLGGKTYTGASVTVPLETAGSGQTISITAADARGRRSAAYTRTIDVQAYTPPAATAFVIERCTADGAALQIDGEHLRFTLEAQAQLVGTASTNRLRAEIYTKLRSEDAWTPAGSYGDTGNTLSLENALLPGTYSPLSSYDVLLRLTDTFGTSVDRLTVITTATSLMHFDPFHKRVTVGRVGESADPDNAMIVALDAYFKAGLYMPDGRNVPDAIDALEDELDNLSVERVYKSLESIGCTTASTMAEAWQALPVYSMLAFEGTQLSGMDASWGASQLPSGLWGWFEMRKFNGNSRGEIRYMYKETGCREYRMAITSGNVPSGMWYCSPTIVYSETEPAYTAGVIWMKPVE